jgi:hypothetical protein
MPFVIRGLNRANIESAFQERQAYQTGAAYFCLEAASLMFGLACCSAPRAFCCLPRHLLGCVSSLCSNPEESDYDVGNIQGVLESGGRQVEPKNYGAKLEEDCQDIALACCLPCCLFFNRKKSAYTGRLQMSPPVFEVSNVSMPNYYIVFYQRESSYQYGNSNNVTAGSYVLITEIREHAFSVEEELNRDHGHNPDGLQSYHFTSSEYCFKQQRLA